MKNKNIITDSINVLFIIANIYLALAILSTDDINNTFLLGLIGLFFIIGMIYLIIFDLIKLKK